MSDTKRKIRYILRYLSDIISSALFIILLILAIILGYYFVSTKLSNKSGVNNQPAFSIYTIVSGSMIPTIDVYDVVINVKVNSPSELETGDIITFISTSPASAGMTITHRVKDIQIINGEYEYITKGDNNLIQDGTPAKYANIIGKAVVRIPQLGRVQIFIASKFGWLVIVVIPALIVVIKDILKLIRLSKIKKDAERVNQNLEKKENEELL